MNHWDILAISTLIVVKGTPNSLCLKNKFVSSANMMISAIFDALTMSFIKRMNKRGPKIEPWGTLHVTGKVSELV